MIRHPEELDFSSQNFSMLIYGPPGIGKTTLALSAPDPVLIDFDRGISRVRAEHRQLTITLEEGETDANGEPYKTLYDAVKGNMRTPEVKDAKTVIIDTGGSFVTCLKDWAMATQPTARTKTGDFNSLRGFGFVKTEFAAFTEMVKTAMGKNLIFVFHAQESQDNDGNISQRLLCEGSARNTVWNGCDFGGYVQMVGNKRTICFTPTDSYFAKGSHGIHGGMAIPELANGAKNDFITRLFDTARKNIAAENSVYAEQREKYNGVMDAVHVILGGVENAETANDALEKLKNMEHALTSRKEASALLKSKAEELGLIFTKGAGYTEA